MSIVIDHLEYLLQRHDCVTVPRLGAMMVRYRPARFESADSDILLPPARELAFNGAMTESDGLLEASVARQYGISFEAARRMVEEEISGLLHHLRHLGELHLGRLGQLQTTVRCPWTYRHRSHPGGNCHSCPVSAESHQSQRRSPRRIHRSHPYRGSRTGNSRCGR